jgi:hypothetical protein
MKIEFYSIHLEKEPSSYAEVSLEGTPLTTTNKSLSSNDRRSTGSIHPENSTHQILPSTTIKIDDINTPKSFT